jgi:hypothetical protein
MVCFFIQQVIDAVHVHLLDKSGQQGTNSKNNRWSLGHGCHVCTPTQVMHPILEQF